jgi:hypothetical protein
MKYAFSFLAFVCLAIANGQTTTSESDEVKEHPIKLEKQSWEAWKDRDSKFFQDFLSDDHVEVGFGGLTNKAQVVAVVGSPICTVKSYKRPCSPIGKNKIPFATSRCHHPAGSVRST